MQGVMVVAGLKISHPTLRTHAYTQWESCAYRLGRKLEPTLVTRWDGTPMGLRLSPSHMNLICGGEGAVHAVQQSLVLCGGMRCDQLDNKRGVRGRRREGE